MFSLSAVQVFIPVLGCWSVANLVTPLLHSSACSLQCRIEMGSSAVQTRLITGRFWRDTSNILFHLFLFLSTVAPVPSDILSLSRITRGRALLLDCLLSVGCRAFKIKPEHVSGKCHNLSPCIDVSITVSIPKLQSIDVSIAVLLVSDTIFC